MKKFICICLIISLIVCLVGCGNMAILDPGTYTFSTIHFFDENGNCADGTIVKWHNDQTGLEVKTKEFGSIFVSEGTYILFENECPLCN